MNSKTRYFTLLLFACMIMLIPQKSHAQDVDNVAWLSVSLNKKFNNDWSASLTPIIRLNEDFSSYQNYSIDYAFKRNLNESWSVQFLGRTWFLKDGSNRQFAWIDLNYNHKIGNFVWSNKLRWHNALDIQDQVDPDFLRWSQTFKYVKWKKFQPMFGIENWWGLNGAFQYERIRYQPGFNLNFNKNLSLAVVYWRQESINLIPEADVNIYRVNLVYKLSALSKKN